MGSFILVTDHTRTDMQTKERPPTDPPQTCTQTEAAKLCGVTQRSLVDRTGKRGYLSKLHQCFPGKYFKSVAIGSIKNQSSIRLTTKGVEELRDLIQALSPEPPVLLDGRPTYDSLGKVVKRKQSPHTLNQYAEYVWFKEEIDGSNELSIIAQHESQPTQETIDAAAIEEEQVLSGSVVHINQTDEPIELAYEQIEAMDSNFWEEAERRAISGYQQGRFLKSIELKARTQAEFDLENDHSQRSKNVASRKRSS